MGSYRQPDTLMLTTHNPKPTCDAKRKTLKRPLMPTSLPAVCFAVPTATPAYSGLTAVRTVINIILPQRKSMISRIEELIKQLEEENKGLQHHIDKTDLDKESEYYISLFVRTQKRMQDNRAIIKELNNIIKKH